MERSNAYIVGFAAAVCLVCSIIVSSAAVSLKDRQELNAALDVQEKVLVLAGVAEDGELAPEEIGQQFEERIVPRIIDMANGTYVDGIDAATFDLRKAAKDPATSSEAPPNDAQVRRLPQNSVVYHVKGDSGQVESLILPIHGKGLWSTLYGYLALGRDGNTIQGITFYEHGETPGLGGEVDNPRWKSLWKGRKAFGADGSVAIRVKKGQAGTPDADPHQVDGLSGATITSRGVSNTLAFWLGNDGFGSYLEKFRAEMGV